jgi:hypothetical protein
MAGRTGTPPWRIPQRVDCDLDRLARPLALADALFRDSGWRITMPAPHRGAAAGATRPPRITNNTAWSPRVNAPAHLRVSQRQRKSARACSFWTVARRDHSRRPVKRLEGTHEATSNDANVHQDSRTMERLSKPATTDALRASLLGVPSVAPCNKATFTNVPTSTRCAWLRHAVAPVGSRFAGQSQPVSP